MVVYYGTKLRKIAPNTSKLFGEINVAIVFGSSQNGPKASQNSRNSPSLKEANCDTNRRGVIPLSCFPQFHDATRFEVRGSQNLNGVICYDCMLIKEGGQN